MQAVNYGIEKGTALQIELPPCPERQIRFNAIVHFFALFLQKPPLFGFPECFDGTVLRAAIYDAGGGGFTGGLIKLFEKYVGRSEQGQQRF